MISNKAVLTSKGSFTVEASILFSVIFLLVAALVYILIMIYQYAFLQSVASQAANAGANYYVNQYEDGYSKSNSNLYWRIFDTHSEVKTNKINGYISKKLDQSIFTTKRDINNYTSYKFLLKQLYIRIEDNYPLPIGNLFKIFGIPSTINLRAEVNSPLDDNAEFVRNLDIVIDIKNCILNSDNKWIGEGTKVNEIIDKLLKKN